MSQALVIASAGLLSIGALSLTLTLLLAKQGQRKALGFAAGYFAAYVLIGLGFVTFFGQESAPVGTDEASSPWFFVAFGIIFFGLGLKNLLTKPKAGAPSGFARFFHSVDALSLSKTFLIGLGVPFINFKSLAIFLSALAVLPEGGGRVAQLTQLLLIAAVFCAPVLLPNLVTILVPRYSTRVLPATKRFLERYSRPIVTYVPLALGALFIINALAG